MEGKNGSDFGSRVPSGSAGRDGFLEASRKDTSSAEKRAQADKLMQLVVGLHEFGNRNGDIEAVDKRFGYGVSLAALDSNVKEGPEMDFYSNETASAESVKKKPVEKRSSTAGLLRSDRPLQGC